MGQPVDARLTPELATEICERMGSTAVVEGLIGSLGSRNVLGLRARYCRNGDVLAEEQAQAARKEEVLTALDEASKRSRTRAADCERQVQQHAAVQRKLADGLPVHHFAQA